VQSKKPVDPAKGISSTYIDSSISFDTDGVVVAWDFFAKASGELKLQVRNIAASFKRWINMYSHYLFFMLRFRSGGQSLRAGILSLAVTQ
jgi:hypothetical protein